MVDRRSERRMVENEIFFRQQNEDMQKNLEKINRMNAEDGNPIPIVETDMSLHFYCECSDENCRKRLVLTLADYRKAHIKRDQFIVLPGHEVIAVERVVRKEPAYLIVQKRLEPPEHSDTLHTTDVHNL